MQKKIGIVLSGGGARGFAHLGMLEVLFENKIFPDCIAGTSIGAIVGALIADGKHPAEIFEIFENKVMLSFVRPAFSWKALLNLEGMRELLAKHLSVSTIENLSVKSTFVATDLFEGKAVPFTKGDILDALMASAAIPMVFEPIKIKEKLYADGGLTCNLPTRFLSADVILGCNLVPVPTISKLQTPIQMADRTVAIAIAQNAIADKKNCHVILEPEQLYKYRFLDTGKAKELYALGKKEAATKLSDIQRTIAN